MAVDPVTADAPRYEPMRHHATSHSLQNDPITASAPALPLLPEAPQYQAPIHETAVHRAVVPPEPLSAPADATAGTPPSQDETALDPPPRRWGRVVVGLVSVVAVVVIVALIRANAPGETPGTLTPTTVTSGSASHAALIPVSSRALDQFTSVSKPLNAANVTVTKALANGSNQTVPQITQEVAPYITALDKFLYTSHSIVWPEALQVPAEDLTLRTQALITFLQSASTTNPAALSSWFAQLHSLGTQAVTADNLIRKDIGLSPTSSYP
jgi:hypothetical protein